MDGTPDSIRGRGRGGALTIADEPLLSLVEAPFGFEGEQSCIYGALQSCYQNHLLVSFRTRYARTTDLFIIRFALQYLFTLLPTVIHMYIG